MRTLCSIYRYPIKGLSPQPVPSVTLEAGKPFPFDRVFALARPGTPYDAQAPGWAKKGLFLMLMLEDSLARVHTSLDVDTLQLEVRPLPSQDPGRQVEPLLRADLRSRAGQEAVETFFRAQVEALREAPRLLRAVDGHFMDKPENVISCINLATLRLLETELGVEVHPLRFRANFYIDGGAPWEEFDWVGSDIALGDVLFRVDRRNGRCGATNVNPVTGRRDLDIPRTLRERYGHKDLGIYLVARTGGNVAIGDQVRVAEREGGPPAGPASPFESTGSSICRGCYYVYEDDQGAPGVAAGTPFADIPASWRCPDCGTHKGDFRPYAGGSK